MGRTKRLYPLGKYRLRTPKNPDKNKAYPVDIEYTWNRKVIRRTTNIFVKIADWNQNLHAGRGGVRPSYGSESKRINSVLLARVERTDSLLAEFAQNNPHQITDEVIDGFLLEKPVAVRKDNGKDFVEFVTDRLDSEYSRNRIGRSRYENGKSGMNMFKEFLRSTGKGTYKSDGIYLGEISIELLEEYIEWRREIKQNSDHTINHALTPILKACAYAAELQIIDVALNARIQDMRIAVKPNLSGDESSYDGKSLSQEEIAKLIDYYHHCKEPRRKEYIEMFLFAFHACGLRVVDIMTIQWSNVDLNKKELRKVMIKTGKRHIIPLSDPAVELLETWKEKNGKSKFVFNLVKESLDIDDDEALYKVRNTATRSINQSLTVVGEELGFSFPLTMHVARHSFAVYALNEGLSMSVVSRLLGHGSTDITEKVYARFLPETLSSELGRLSGLSSFKL